MAPFPGLSDETRDPGPVFAHDAKSKKMMTDEYDNRRFTAESPLKGRIREAEQRRVTTMCVDMQETFDSSKDPPSHDSSHT
jgi:hypothetical protein